MSLAGAVTYNSIKANSSVNKRNEEKTMSNTHNSRDDSNKTTGIIRLSAVVLMVTLVRRAEGSNYTLRRCAS